MLTIGTLLQNRYRIVHELGQGGMGAVYKALDERLDKTVAIKEVIIEPEAAADEYQRNLIQKSFQREANSLVKARHEAVPDITDYFTELERQFLVMEYIEGDDLAKLLEKRGKPFSFEEVSPWINQLLEALIYLHNLMPPILHRDIKPQNLKLNERQKIKLLDFGIARSADKNSPISQHTFLAATLNYAPFEQVLRVIAPTFREFILLKHRDKAERFIAQDTDARCDVFGVGATFYHLLTNQAPIDVTRRALGIWEAGADELVNPSKINPEISPGVSEWLLKALAFERENRFTSAGEMKEALQRIATENKAGFSLIGQSRLEEAILAREQQLMQAKTESLIHAEITESEISPADKFSSTADPALGAAATDYKFPNTNSSVQSIADNQTEKYFVNNEELLISPQEPAPQNDNITPPQTKHPAPNNRKYSIALAIMAILLLAMSVVGLYTVISLIRNEQTQRENNPTNENINIVKTPETTPSVQESVQTTQGNTETNAVTNTETISNTVKKEPEKTPTTVPPTETPIGKPTVEQTQKPTPTAKPTVTRTPTPTVTKTPTPKLPDYFVICHLKNSDGTITQIRKNRCPECPKLASCELIFVK